MLVAFCITQPAINISKSNFMIFGHSELTSSFSTLSLTVCVWIAIILSILPLRSRNVSGTLNRIKYLLPRYARLLLGLPVIARVLNSAMICFLMSRHVIIYIIMIGFENLRAFHAPLLIWLPRVPVVESVHIASIYFIMWLASALIITTLTMLTIAHVDRGRPTLKDDERFLNRMDNFQTQQFI